MRDFRDAKAMARTLREALAAKGVTISNSEALELAAKMLGERDWNTLAAVIDAARPPPAPTAPTASGPTPRSAEAEEVRGFSTPALRRTLRQAFAAADERRHEYATFELVTWSRHPRRSESARSIASFRWIGKIRSLRLLAQRGLPEAS